MGNNPGPQDSNSVSHKISHYTRQVMELYQSPAGYWTTRGYANSRIANLRTGQLADRTSGGLVNLRTRQLADATSDFACLVFVLLVASARPRVVQSVTCPVREMSSPRVGNPRVGVSASCPVTLQLTRKNDSQNPENIPGKISIGAGSGLFPVALATYNEQNQQFF